MDATSLIIAAACGITAGAIVFMAIRRANKSIDAAFDDSGPIPPDTAEDTKQQRNDRR